MKKYIITALAALTLLALASCGEDDTVNNGNRMADDARNGVRDMTDGVERAADDFTDDTMFDTDNNYNVDDYTANGDETK